MVTLVRAKRTVATDLHSVILETDDYFFAVPLAQAGAAKIGYSSMFLLSRENYEECGAIDDTMIHPVPETGNEPS